MDIYIVLYNFMLYSSLFYCLLFHSIFQSVVVCILFCLNVTLYRMLKCFVQHSFTIYILLFIILFSVILFTLFCSIYSIAFCSVPLVFLLSSLITIGLCVQWHSRSWNPTLLKFYFLKHRSVTVLFIKHLPRFAL